MLRISSGDGDKWNKIIPNGVLQQTGYKSMITFVSICSESMTYLYVVRHFHQICQ